MNKRDYDIVNIWLNTSSEDEFNRVLNYNLDSYYFPLIFKLNKLKKTEIDFLNEFLRINLKQTIMAITMNWKVYKNTVYLRTKEDLDAVKSLIIVKLRINTLNKIIQ